MILTLAALFVALWLLGVFMFHVASALIHLLLAVAVLLTIYSYVVRRRRANGTFRNVPPRG
jgi:Family of unknown function (DUF5670)